MRKRRKVQLLSKLTERAECSVSGSMRWMFRMSQLLGIAPVRFNGSRVSVSPALCYIHCVAMSVMNTMAIYALVIDLNMDFNHSIHIRRFSQRILWPMDFSAVMLIASVAAYGGRSRVTEVIKCLSRVQKIKEALNYQASECLERKKRLVLVFFLVFSTSCVVIKYIVFVMAVLEDGKDLLTIMLYSGYDAAFILVFMLQMQYLITALEVYEPWKGLNEFLEMVSRLDSLQSFVVNQSSTKTAAETIRHLASEYRNLCSVMKQLEKAFGLSVIFLLISCLLHSVITTNHAIYQIVNNLQHVGTSLQFKLSWCVLHFLRIVLVIEPSYRTQVEMDRTNLQVSQLILQNNDCELSEELNKFYKYILLNKTTYIPMGVCTVNRPLLTSILSSVVTYVVFSVQF